MMWADGWLKSCYWGQVNPTSKLPLACSELLPGLHGLESYRQVGGGRLDCLFLRIHRMSNGGESGHGTGFTSAVPPSESWGSGSLAHKKHGKRLHGVSWWEGTCKWITILHCSLNSGSKMDSKEIWTDAYSPVMEGEMLAGSTAVQIACACQGQVCHPEKRNGLFWSEGSILLL